MRRFMPRFPRSSLIALFAGLALPALAAAQDKADGPPQWYDVEIVVFEQAGGSTVAPPSGVHEPDTFGALSLDTMPGSPDAAVASMAPVDAMPPLGPPQPRFQQLSPEDQQLGGAVGKLSQSARYRVLVHAAWRQRAPEFGESEPVRIEGGRVLGSRPAAPAGAARPSPLVDLGEAAANPDTEAVKELDGVAAVTRGRYLHLRLDLVYRQRASSGPLAAGNGRGYSPAGQFVTWRLAERRQIEPGKLQYFDHEHFAAIAVVTPWQPPEDEEATPEVKAPVRDDGTTG